MSEAEFLAKSIKDVSDHYTAGLLDQKTLDWANLAQCLAMVYGGRIYAIRQKLRGAKIPDAPARAEAVRAGPQPSVHRTAPPVNEMSPAAPEEYRNGEIAGVGNVVFPPDHPLVRKDN